MKKNVILLIGFFITCFALQAQQYNFRHYTTKNGLASPFINHIFCDSRGFMWMSTQGGLSRFDGKNVTNYTSREGLPGSDILCVNEDSKGNIWIGTNGFGVALFNGSAFKVYNSKNGLVNDVVYSIATDKQGQVWLATMGGISRFSGEKFTNYTTAGGLPDNAYFAVCTDNTGNIWFGSKNNGPVKYNGKSFTTLPDSSRFRKQSVFSLHCDQEGTLWMGTPGTGLGYLKNNIAHKFADDRLANEFISAIAHDSHGNVWVATDNQLVKITGSRKQYYTTKNGLTSNTIYSLGFDHDGKLWIGTINGLNVFVNEAFTSFNEKDGLTNNNITVFLRDGDNHLLIGTAGNGLNIYDGRTIEKVNIPGLNQGNIITMMQSRSGKLYIGLNNGSEGIVVLEKRNGKYMLHSQIKRLGNQVFSTVSGIVETSNGDIIVSTFGNGIWRMKDGEFTALADTTVFTSKDVMAMHLDSKQNLWIALNQQGLVKYNARPGAGAQGKHFTRFTTENGLGDNTILSICEDKNHNLVFGNYENGITVYNGKRFVTYNKKQGLCSNNVQAVTADGNNHLWIGTNNGLNRVKLGKNMELESVKLYNETNGLLGTEINQNAIFADDDNTLWIGSNMGLTRYTPHYDYRNTTPPGMTLTQVKLNFTDPDWKQRGDKTDLKTGLPVEPVFAHYDNHLTFYFQALTIDRVEFSYMLEGLDSKWTPLDTKNEADYTNIPPGEYVFRVKAKNSDGVWSSQNLNFAFTIRPPFWQTWWFRISAAILVIALIIIIFKWRTAQLAREKKVLEDKVAARTNELSLSNAQLSVALEDIKDSIHYAQKIQESILPDSETFAEMMPNAFVLFMPKDIVSGDFYWVDKIGDNIIYATCDCTGHGVPGGFMTMLGTSFLNEIIHEKKQTRPDEVLNEMREKIIEALRQTGSEGESKDGMDMVLCKIDTRSHHLQFAAANNSFYVVRNGELMEMKADKQPISYFSIQTPFNLGQFQLQAGDMVYTFTDGYADQFGGPRGKKFKYRQLEDLFVSIAAKPMQEQKILLEQAIMEWMSGYEQIDDILVMGYRVA